MRLHSAPGVGAPFTLYLPVNYTAQQPIARIEGRAHQIRPAINGMESLVGSTRLKPSLLANDDQEDDRDSIAAGDRVLLVIDDDPTYSRIFLDAAMLSR